VTTARELIDMITATAAELRDGLDTDIEFGICDGNNLELIDDVDIDFYARVPTDGSPGGTQLLIICGHHHPGQKPGELLRGAAADVDDELRNLTGQDEA
jgi:hypothetical protein